MWHCDFVESPKCSFRQNHDGMPWFLQTHSKHVVRNKNPISLTKIITHTVIRHNNKIWMNIHIGFEKT